MKRQYIVPKIMIAGLFLAACATDNSDSSGSTDDDALLNDDSTAVQDASGYIATPAGWYHHSCVHEIADDATLDEQDTITRSDGSTSQTPPCAFPPKVDALADSASPPADNAGPPVVNSWVVDAQKQVTGWIKDMTAEWVVPLKPTSQGAQIVYFFDGIEPADKQHILQPVLQYNHDGHHDWQIADWFCGPTKGSCFHKRVRKVAVGDLIRGRMTGSNCSSNGACDWKVTATDVTSGVSAGALTRHASVPYPNAYNTLEAYGIDHCNKYPNSGAIAFKSIHVTRGDGSESTFRWDIRRWSVSPACSRDGNSIDFNDVALFWNP